MRQARRAAAAKRGARRSAFDQIMRLVQAERRQVQEINGWMFTTKTGIYGTNYIQRALVTAIGLGANRPQDAIYPTSLKDGNADWHSPTAARRNTSCTSTRASCRRRGLLVADHVRRRLFLRHQSPQPLRDQRAAEPQGQRRRFRRSLHPEGHSRRGQGVELAARAAKGKFILMLRLYWPEKTALDPQRLLGHPAGEGSPSDELHL